MDLQAGSYDQSLRMKMMDRTSAAKALKPTLDTFIP